MLYSQTRVHRLLQNTTNDYNSRIIKSFIKANVEIGKIADDHVRFILGKDKGFSLKVPCQKGFINYDKLLKQYVSALDFVFRQNPTQDKLDLLTFYLEKEDSDRLRYYELLFAIETMGPIAFKQFLPHRA